MTSLKLIHFLWLLFVLGCQDRSQGKNQQPDWFHTKANDEQQYDCNKDSVKSGVRPYFPSPSAQIGVNNLENIGRLVHTQIQKGGHIFYMPA